MLVFNRSQARIRVNNKKALFEVRSSIKVMRTSHSGLGCALTLTGYSNGLAQFAWNHLYYNIITIFLTAIGCLPLFLGYSVLAADMKRELFGCCFVVIELFVILRRIINL